MRVVCDVTVSRKYIDDGTDRVADLIPEDPRLVPDQAKRDRARERFAEIAPDADEVEVKVSETVEFFDCGANFERVLCPACRSEIPTAVVARSDE